MGRFLLRSFVPAWTFAIFHGFVPAVAADTVARPNVVRILADDRGYETVGVP